MSKPIFNLVHEPWIPCERQDGSRIQLGLLQVFKQAHELAGIHDESPLVTAALHRLLLAVVHRCFGPANLEEWQKLRERGRFDIDRIGTYLSEWEHRFDLFDDTCPFFQTPKLAFEPKLPGTLIVRRSSYGAAVHLFESRPQADSTHISTVDAARHLLATQAFHTGGTITGDRRRGDPTSAVAAPLSSLGLVLLRADSLFDTLLLNTLLYCPEDDLPVRCTGQDAPVWERAPCTRPQKRTPDGWLDWLTWQSRRIQLKPSADGQRVSGVIIAGGYDQEVPEKFEPMAAYTEDEKKGVRAMSLSKDRAFWRDSHTYLDFRSQKQTPPRQVTQAGILMGRGLIPEGALELSVFGQHKYQAKIFITRAETLPLPKALLADANLLEMLKQAIATAEEAQSILGKAVYFAAVQALSSIGTRSPDKSDVRSLADSTLYRPRYWAGLGEPFREFLRELGTDEEAIQPFLARVDGHLRASYDQAVEQLRAGAPGLRAAVRGREVLDRERTKLFPPTKESTDA